VDRQQRNLLILGNLLLVLLVVGFYVFLLGPLREDLAERRAEREAKQEQLSQLDAEVARLEDIQSRAPEIERQLLELSRRVPEQPELPTLVVQVQEIAEESDVTQLLVQREDPEEPEDGGDYTVVPVTMTFEGTYDQLQDFLLRLRNLTRLVTVENIVYEVAEEEGEDGEEEGEVESPGEDRTLQIELGAEVYAQPGEGGIQTIAAPEDSATDVEGGSEEDQDAE
jgi:type IV pilus assembly protein PilO